MEVRRRQTELFNGASVGFNYAEAQADLLLRLNLLFLGGQQQTGALGPLRSPRLSSSNLSMLHICCLLSIGLLIHLYCA